MKLFFIAALLVSSTVVGMSQTDRLRSDEIRLQALHMNTEGDIQRLEGNVRIETAAVVLQADEASFNRKTNEIDAQGHVHVALK